MIDLLQLERSFLQASRKIEQITEELEEYKVALFNTEECGKSVKELYLNSSASSPFFHLKQVYHAFKYPDVQDFQVRLERYLSYYHEYENKNHFWAHERSFAEFSSGDYLEIRRNVEDAIETFEQIREDSAQMLQKAIDYETAIYFLQKRKSLKQLIINLDNETAYKYFKVLLARSPDESSTWLVDLERTIMQSFKGAGPEKSLKAADLGRFQEALEHALKARRNLFSWIHWKLFSKDRILITRVLVANELKSNKEGFEVLLERVDNRLNLEHNLSIIEDKPWLQDFPQKIKKIDYQNWFFYQRLAYKTYEVFKELRSIDGYISFKTNNRKKQIAKLTEFLKLLDRIPIHRQIWNRYLTDNQLRQIMGGHIKIERTLKELEVDFEKLHDYHSLLNGFTKEEKYVVDELEEHKESIPEKINQFHNSLALAWIDHIESKYPVLRHISSLKFEQSLKELREAVQEKRKTSQEILLLKSRERTYESIEYNRLNNRVTYRDLEHQVNKKKRIWPLRRVISEFREELFQLIPCWLASPESASAIFPMEQFFDLVIFDEASQCFAERGIPSMYRGKQVVIAGDEKQLKPFDLYRVRWEEESEEDLPELEIDSLLDLSKRYLAKQPLEGHYRSKSLELIEFSNQHFYDGKLQMLPDREHVNKTETAINFIKVEGLWENNTNLSEAEKVIELISEFTLVSPDKSIGVVTFNARQQGLILDLMEERLTGYSYPRDFFIKNIENVQGDEKDIIIFSLAYAPDKQGNLQMRFGSLNLDGGENRLNVAITRAREKIYVISSLWPEQLKTENLQNKGPKLLKAYLEFAVKTSSGNYQPRLPEHHFGRGWYLHQKVKESFQRLNQELIMESDLPFADLSVKYGKEYQGLILTDDEKFHQSVSIKDHFVMKPEIFQEKNWPALHLYSREFWNAPDQVEDKIRMFLNRVN
jgi:superfamily I DNA and/or RNA helicase